MNILVTGANGFIGSHLVNHLKKENKVVSLVYDTVMGDWQNNALEGTYQARADIRNMAALREILSRFEINQVYHTAAISLVKTAHRDPMSVYAVNAMGTLALLEACRTVGTERILVMNTDKVYGEGLDATEERRYQFSEPYGTSKACQGFIAKSHMETYGMNIVMSHCCNVFGYDPFSNRIVPNVVKKCLRGQSPWIFTNDDSIREYVYVEDKVAAIESLMNDDTKIGSYNISTGWVYNQKDIVLKILEFFDGLEPEYVESKLPAQIKEQSLKSVRWDWKPKWKFEDAIKATIEGFKKYRNDWN
ncbi:MAG: NAD-dependent epimerase/dehydratase family protein [Candidatus Thorarchaeota archaeon]